MDKIKAEFLRLGSILIACLHAGVSGKYFNQPCLSLIERIKTVYLALEAGLSVEQVTNVGFNLAAFPSHGKDVLKILSQGKYSFDQLMNFSRKKVFALGCGIEEEIIDDPKFHEEYIELLRQHTNQKEGWKKLRNISLDKLVFVRRQGIIDQFDLSVNSQKSKNIGLPVGESITLRTKLFIFELPWEVIADLSFTQLSFIYWERFPFVKPLLADNVYVGATYEERYWIAKQCTDFDIQCLCRLNIRFERLIEYPHLGIEHLHAVEEGYPMEQVLSCLDSVALQALRRERGRPPRQVVDTEATRAFEKNRLWDKSGISSVLDEGMPIRRKITDDPVQPTHASSSGLPLRFSNSLSISPRSDSGEAEKVKNNSHEERRKPAFKLL